MASRTRPEISAAELQELVVRALAAAPDGLSPSALRRALPAAYRPAEDVWPELLRSLESSGTIHRWPKGRTGTFATRSFESWLAERVRQALATGPLTAGELQPLLPAASRSVVPRLLKRLVQEGRLFAHPRSARRLPYGVRPHDDADYVVGDELRRLLASLQRRGLAEAAVRAAAARWSGLAPTPIRAQDPGALLLERMQELNPQVAGGALVYLPHLRTALRDALPGKVDFDRAVLALAEQRRIQLQSHPVPSQLRPEECASMIEDGRGSFYMAIGLRQA